VLVSGGVGAGVVTMLGTGTTALLVKSAWVRGVLYHGQNLTASAVYGRELFATQDLAGYFVLLVGLPIIWLAMALTGAGASSALHGQPASATKRAHRARTGIYVPLSRRELTTKTPENHLREESNWVVLRLRAAEPVGSHFWLPQPAKTNGAH
jgi:hypothetical protein